MRLLLSRRRVDERDPLLLGHGLLAAFGSALDGELEPCSHFHLRRFAILRRGSGPLDRYDDVPNHVPHLAIRDCGGPLTSLSRLASEVLTED